MDFFFFKFDHYDTNNLIGVVRDSKALKYATPNCISKVNNNLYVQFHSPTI